MRKQTTAVAELVQPVITALGYEFWGLEQSGSRGQGVLRIYIDSERGITLDDCARVSRQVEAVLDVEEPLSGSYTLEVSSPGTDRPLFSRQQLLQYRGEKVFLKLGRKVAQRRKLSGILEDVGEDSVRINDDGVVYDIDMDFIDKANLVWQNNE